MPRKWKNKEDLKHKKIEIIKLRHGSYSSDPSHDIFQPKFCVLFLCNWNSPTWKSPTTPTVLLFGTVFLCCYILLTRWTGVGAFISDATRWCTCVRHVVCLFPCVTWVEWSVMVFEVRCCTDFFSPRQHNKTIIYHMLFVPQATLRLKVTDLSS